MSIVNWLSDLMQLSMNLQVIVAQCDQRRQSTSGIDVDESFDVRRILTIQVRLRLPVTAATIEETSSK